MITVELSPYTRSNKKEKMIAGSQKHRATIYERTIEAIYNEENKYGIGTDVEHRAFGAGTIINHLDFDECSWDGLKVKPIEVWFHTMNDFHNCHPSELQPCKG